MRALTALLLTALASILGTVVLTSGAQAAPEMVGVIFELTGSDADAWWAQYDTGQRAYTVATMNAEGEDEGVYADLPEALYLYGAYPTPSPCECLTLPVPADGYVRLPLESGTLWVYPDSVEFEWNV